MWRIFSCLCLTWGHLHKGCLDYRRMKTKRLTRLSVYVESKNVCKWSLAYLHVGKLLWSFFFGQLVLPFCRVSIVLLCTDSGTVTRKVTSGKWDFQDGATGRNSITFGPILCMWRKKAKKGRGIKGKTGWMQRSTQHVNITDWFLLTDLQLKRCCSQTSLLTHFKKCKMKENSMQGWHYGKGLIYYRPIFRLN